MYSHLNLKEKCTALFGGVTNKALTYFIWLDTMIFMCFIPKLTLQNSLPSSLFSACWILDQICQGFWWVVCLFVLFHFYFFPQYQTLEVLPIIWKSQRALFH